VAQVSERIYRSRSFARIGGVCAGVAISRGYSIVLCRIVALGLLSVGFGIPLYLLGWILLPSADRNPNGEPLTPPADPLVRSRHEKIFGGVCGGLAQWWGVDPALVRIGFVLLVLCGGVGLIPYIYAWIVIPQGS